MNEHMRELPGVPAAVAGLFVAAVYAVAAGRRRGVHSQLCPVWSRLAGIETCNCWVLRDVKQDVRLALDIASGAP